MVNEATWLDILNRLGNLTVIPIKAAQIVQEKSFEFHCIFVDIFCLVHNTSSELLELLIMCSCNWLLKTVGYMGFWKGLAFLSACVFIFPHPVCIIECQVSMNVLAQSASAVLLSSVLHASTCIQPKWNPSVSNSIYYHHPTSFLTTHTSAAFVQLRLHLQT